MASRLPLLQTEEEEEEEEELFDQTSLLSRNIAVKNETYIRGHRSGRKLQFARTANLCLAFFALGLCFAIPTATLEDLQKAVAADSESIGFIYTARYSGYVFGSLIGGMLFDRYNRQFLLFLSLLATAVGVIVMPFCTELGALMTCTAVTGLTMGFLDTGGNVWCLDLWGKKSASFLQALHFCFGLGAFAAPLVAEPFLSPHVLNRTDVSVHPVLDNTSVIMNVRLPHVAFPHRGMSSSSKSVRYSGFIDENEINKFPKDLMSPMYRLHYLADHYDLPTKNIADSNNSKIMRNYKMQKRQTSTKYDNNSLSLFEGEDSFLKSNVTTFVTESAISLINSTQNPETMSQASFSKEPDSVVAIQNYESTSEGISEGNLQIPSNNSSIIANISQNSVTNSELNGLYSSTTIKPKPKKPAYADGNQLNHEDKWNRPSLKAKDKDSTVAKEQENKEISILQASIVTPNSTQETYNVDNETTTHHTLYQQSAIDNNITDNFSPSANFSLQYADENESNSSLTVKSDKENHLLFTSSYQVDRLHETSSNSASSVEPLLYKDYPAYPSTPIITPSFSSVLPSLEVNNYLKSENSVSTGNKYKGHTDISRRLVMNKEKPATFISTSYLPEEISVTQHELLRKINSNEAYTSKLIDSSTQQHEVSTQEITSSSADVAISKILLNIQQSNETTFSSKDKSFDSTSEPVVLVASSVQENTSEIFAKHNFSSPTSYANDLMSTFPPSHGGGNTTVLKHFDIFTYLFNLMHEHRLGKFEFAYVILGIYTFIVSIVFLIFLCLNPREPRSKQEEGLDKSKQVTRLFRFSVVGLISLFLCLYVGMEVAVGQLLETFATKQDLQLTKPRGYFLTYLFWGSFALGRGLSIGLALKFSGLKMLVINLVICLSASILLVCAADKIEILLWVGIVILGLGMAPVFPAAIAWVEHYLHVTNLTAATFILGSALGEMALPLIINRFIYQEPMVLMYTNMTVNMLCSATFVVLWWLAVQQGEKYHQQESRGCYWLANCEDGEDGVEMDQATSKWQNNYNCHILQKKSKGRLA